MEQQDWFMLAIAVLCVVAAFMLVAAETAIGRVSRTRVEELAREAGLARVTDKDWGSRTFFTGEAPARRIPDAR